LDRYAIHFKQSLVLLDQRIFRFDENLDERLLVELIERRDHRQAADELGNHAELEQIFGQDVGEQLAEFSLVAALDVGAKTHRLSRHAPANELLDAAKSAAADEQDVRRVDLNELLLRVLAPALGRDIGHRAFDDFQQRLLHAFAADVA